MHLLNIKIVTNHGSLKGTVAQDFARLINLRDYTINSLNYTNNHYLHFFLHFSMKEKTKSSLLRALKRKGNNSMI